MATFRIKLTVADLRVVILGVGLTLAAGCAYPLTIKNLSLYKPTSVGSVDNIKVGLNASTSTPEEERLVMATANAMKRDGYKLSYPFYTTEESKKSVDYLVKLTTSSQYEGSGWNFLINWPGFLIWTPAWHGYNYRAIFGFDADITNLATGNQLPRISSPVDLDIRHADFNRTWTEISWLEWSAIAFVGGIIFTRYDHSVTPKLLDAAEQHIADYVASKISAAIAADKQASPPSPPPVAESH